jgi:hypothetical protein
MLASNVHMWLRLVWAPSFLCLGTPPWMRVAEWALRGAALRGAQASLVDVAPARQDLQSQQAQVVIESCMYCTCSANTSPKQKRTTGGREEPLTLLLDW